MKRRVLLLSLAAAAMGAAQAPAPRSMKALTFLTRDGCVNTPDLVVNLDDALKGHGVATDYQYINIDKLPSSDVRTGYPTPTILYKGRDIFGMTPPRPPYNTPG
jgi:hypothetical protein